MVKHTITEFVQDGTKEIDVEVNVNDLNEFGLIIGTHKEIQKRTVPNFVERVRDMTPEEEAAHLEMEKNAFYSSIAETMTQDAKIRMFIDSIPVAPQPRMANRPGYLWKQIYDAGNNVFGWEEVEDPFYVPTADGSFINPFPFVEGEAVVTGMFYTDGDNIWEAIQNGVPTGFDDRAFFDIVG